MSNDQPQETRHQSGDPTLTEFLLARITEECEAKRWIVKMCSADLTSGHAGSVATGNAHAALAEDILHALATVYADHPDYRDEWRS